MVTLDPVTLDVLRDAHWNDTFFTWIYDVHEYLQLGSGARPWIGYVSLDHGRRAAQRRRQLAAAAGQPARQAVTSNATPRHRDASTTSTNSVARPRRCS